MFLSDAAKCSLVKSVHVQGEIDRSQSVAETDPRWQTGYARLAEYGLSFDLQALPEQMLAAAEVSAAYPRVPMIVNHTGMPRDRTPEGQNGWRRGMRALASHSQVSVKISGFGMFDPAWTVDSIRPFVRTTIDLFGVERCMFASNFPVDKVFRSYAAVFEGFDTLTFDLPAADRVKLFGANAERIYRL